MLQIRGSGSLRPAVISGYKTVMEAVGDGDSHDMPRQRLTV